MLIVIAHGSSEPRWRASVEGLIEPLQAELGQDSVRLAYMDCTPPTLEDVASDTVRAGIKKIRVLPLFLTQEGHVARDIQPLVDKLREAHGAVEVELLSPVGRHPMFLELLYKIAVETAEYRLS